MKKTALAFCAIPLLYVCLFAQTPQQTDAIIKSIIEGGSKTDQPAAENGKTPNIKDDAAVPGKPAKTEKQKPQQMPQAPQPDELLLKTGIQLFTAGLPEAALVKFNELKSKYPESPFRDSAAVWTGKIYVNSGKTGDAIHEFASIREESGEYPSALYFAGEAQYKSGNTAAAIENFFKMSSQFPEHEKADDALIFLGNIFLNERRGSQALDMCIRVINYYSDRETVDDAYFLMGRVYEKDPVLKDLETARKIFRVFMKKADEENHPAFQNSPLKKRVEKELRAIDATYFKMEQ